MANSKSNDVMPSAETLERVMDEYETGMSDSGSVRQVISTLKKNSEKEHNVNFKALKLAYSLKKQSETDRAAYLRHLFWYIKALNLNDQIDMYNDIPTDAMEQAMSPADERTLETVQ